MRSPFAFDTSLFGTPEEPSLSLLYRYWFWGWLFTDASQRDRMRRAEAVRHNVAQRIHLLCYMRRWMLCSFALLWTGIRLQESMSPPWSVASVNTSGALALVVLLVATAEWLLLTAYVARRNQ